MKKTADRIPKLPLEKFLEVVRCMPLVSFDLLVRDAAGRLLLGRRKNDPARGFWFVPGGIIRKGETLQESFARITRDELGQPMLLAEARLKGVYEHFYEENAAGVKDIATHYIVLACDLTWRSDHTELPLNQHDKYGWFTDAEVLDHPRVHANTRAYCSNRITVSGLSGNRAGSELKLLAAGDEESLIARRLSYRIRRLTPQQATGNALTVQFNNVSIVKPAHVYFDGKVTSRTVIFADGAKKTLGIMLPGEYVFNTADKEHMEIIAGNIEVLLPGAVAWQTVKGGESFTVPADSQFSLKVRELTDYCCSFVRD